MKKSQNQNNSLPQTQKPTSEESLKAVAQPHQLGAAEKFKKSPGLIVYHGLGSGKTLTSMIAGEQTKGEKLVIPPASLKANFSKELDKFDVKHDPYHVVSLETFRRRPHEFVNKVKPSMIIADEIHRGRNSDSLSFNALKSVRGEVPKFMGLTGSVISNSPTELVPLINLAAGSNVLGSEKEFKSSYLKEEERRPGFIGRMIGIKPGTVVKAKNLDHLKKRISPYIHSFSGDPEYLKHIPTVERETVKTVMDKPQEHYYDYAFGELPFWQRFKISHNLPPSKQEAKSLNAFLMASRQVSTSPKAFGGPELTPKLKRAIHDISEGVKSDPNFKSVTYSNFLESGLHPLQHELKNRNLKYGLFTGEQDDASRQDIIKKFNKGELRHLLVSKAGVEGLDLKGVKLVQALDPNWNPEVTNQLIGRAARFKSHEHLPEGERKVKVKEYLSEPYPDLLTRIKKIWNPNAHKTGVDEYIKNISDQKGMTNQQFIDMIRTIHD